VVLPFAEIRFLSDSICINDEFTFEIVNPKSVAFLYLGFAMEKLLPQLIAQ